MPERHKLFFGEEGLGNFTGRSLPRLIRLLQSNPFLERRRALSCCKLKEVQHDLNSQRNCLDSHFSSQIITQNH